MCGIAGLYNTSGDAVSPDALRRMAGALAHRGPDAHGQVLLRHGAGGRVNFGDIDAGATGDESGPCGMAHQRLSIIDLSDAGRQPRSNDAGSVWICFNGEIYNYIELRAELEAAGRRFHTDTDTEVLLQAYETWGLDCLHRFNGMWAIALWDTARERLLLARDRFGIKPLYWARKGAQFAFASEPKALLTLDWVSAEPDERAIADYLVHSREDCFSWTFFKDIHQLEPGHFLELPFHSTAAPEPRRWWRIEDTLTEPVQDDRDAQEQFRALLESAVRLRLRSDVPVGTCLSGGLDSTAIVCLARPELTGENQKSYSAVYGADFALDETEHIDTVAAYARIANEKCYPTAEMLRDELDTLVRQQDEPFGSTSQYAQYKVFQLCRQHGTKVTLDGQGADELLGGYHYFFPVHIASQVRAGHLRCALSEFQGYRRATGWGWSRSVLAAAAGFFDHRTMIRLANRYDRGRATDWVRPHVAREARRIDAPGENPFPAGLNRRLYDVFSSAGLPALLRYEDRNSMAFGVEARLPFLDHRLVSFLFSQAPLQKIRGGETKYVMREALKGRIPESVRVRSDKIGFATPEAAWYRDALFPFMHDVFSSDTTRRRGLYDQERILSLLARNRAGQVDAGRALWRALNLEWWFRVFVD